MTHASLFSGIGGFDLAADWTGWKNLFNCEKDPFCRQILNYYWPQAISYEDIKTTDFKPHREAIDVLTGGFPCQPFSTAGKRAGADDDRYLWPEMLRAIREIHPRVIVAENVPGLLTIGQGLVFEQVCTDLEGEGYEVQPFIIPACGVNAPHRRDRVWFVAYSDHIRCKRLFNADGGKGSQCDDKQFSGCDRAGHDGWQRFPTQSPVCSGNDGLPVELVSFAVRSGRGRRTLTEKETRNRLRNESLKAYGNAVVPQVVFQIFKAIEISLQEPKQ